MRPELVDATVKRKKQGILKRSDSDGNSQTPNIFEENKSEKKHSNKYTVQVSKTEETELNQQGSNTSASSNFNRNCVSVIQSKETDMLPHLPSQEESNLNTQDACLTDIIEEENHNIDIEQIAEVCYTEEQKSISRICRDDLSSTSSVTNDDQNSNSRPLLPFKKRRTDHYNGISMKIYDQPSLTFTFEEEFRLEDLIARREYVNYRTISYMEKTNPTMEAAHKKRMYADILNCKKITFDDDYLDFYFGACRKIGKLIFL